MKFEIRIRWGPKGLKIWFRFGVLRFSLGPLFRPRDDYEPPPPDEDDGPPDDDGEEE